MSTQCQSARGYFITLEGVEGAGKSSQIPVMEAVVREAGLEVITTREPGGTALAEAIRSVLLDGDGMPAMTELLLMFAARSSHVEEHIRPALDRGCWVICDRFVDASYAYQGAGRGIQKQTIEMLESITLQGLQPDMTLVFDLPVEQGLERTRLRGNQNRFDQEDVSFMQRIRDAYLERANQYPERYRLIDASQTVEPVSAAVKDCLNQLIDHARSD